MAREIQVIARIEPSLYKRLYAAKRETGMTMKGILRHALIEWLERLQRRKSELTAAE